MQVAFVVELADSRGASSSSSRGCFVARLLLGRGAEEGWDGGAAAVSRG